MSQDRNTPVNQNIYITIETTNTNTETNKTSWFMIINQKLFIMKVLKYSHEVRYLNFHSPPGRFEKYLNT